MACSVFQPPDNILCNTLHYMSPKSYCVLPLDLLYLLGLQTCFLPLLCISSWSLPFAAYAHQTLPLLSSSPQPEPTLILFLLSKGTCSSNCVHVSLLLSSLFNLLCHLGVKTIMRYHPSVQDRCSHMPIHHNMVDLIYCFPVWWLPGQLLWISLHWNIYPVMITPFTL